MSGTSRQRVAQRLASTAVYGAGPVAILGVIALQDKGLLASTPLWLLAAVILWAGISNYGSAVWLSKDPSSEFRLQIRIATSVFTTAAVIYLAGWGSVLLIAFALGSAELLRVIGPGATRPNMIWNWVAIAIGETAVGLGWAPSMIDVGLGHAIAIAGGVCLTIVTDVLGTSAKTTAEAETALRERSRFFEDLVERAADIIGVIHASGRIDSVSPASEAMLGFTPAEALGRPITDFLDPALAGLLPPLLAKVVADRGTPTVVETRLCHRDGSIRTVIATLTCPSESWNDFIIINLHDVTTQRELEELLRHDARHDHLTGLLNRAAFGDAAARAATRAERRGCSVGMLYIDLDGFKQINDSLGHETGDRVLIETAARLAECLDTDHVLARLGGDEFAVLIESNDCRQAATDTAERILDAVSRPIPGLRTDVRVGASIGIAVRDSDGIEMSTLMRQADEAMYKAKRNGRGCWELRDSTE